MDIVSKKYLKGSIKRLKIYTLLQREIRLTSEYTIQVSINFLIYVFLQYQKIYYSQKRQMNSRLGWSLQEQKFLKTLKQQQKITSWKIISQIMNSKYLDSCRTGKQCRDRYVNFVRFNSESPKIQGWTQQEDLMLFKKIEEHGAKWVLISSEMPGRSENNLKNRYYGSIRKIMRKIVKAQKQMKPKPKKTIKQKCIIRFFEQCRKTRQNQTALQVYKNLLKLAVSQDEHFSHKQVVGIIEKIHQLNNNKLQGNKSIEKESNKSTCSSNINTEQFQKQNQFFGEQFVEKNQSVDISNYKKWDSLMNSIQLNQYDNGMIDFTQYPFQMSNANDFGEIFGEEIFEHSFTL